MAGGLGNAARRRVARLALGLGLACAAPAAEAQWFFQPADVPPGEIARQLQDRGYALTQPLVRRNEVYLADVEAAPGRFERLIIDARSGRTVERFVAAGPAWRGAGAPDFGALFGDVPPPTPPAIIEQPLSRETLSEPGTDTTARLPKRDVARAEDAGAPTAVYGTRGGSEPTTGAPRKPGVRPTPIKPKPIAPAVASEPRKPAPLAAKPASPEPSPPAATEAETKSAAPAPQPTAAPTSAAASPSPEAAKNVEVNAPAPAAAQPPKPVAAAEPALEAKAVEPAKVDATRGAVTGATAKPQALGKSDKINDIPVSPLE